MKAVELLMRRPSADENHDTYDGDLDAQEDRELAFWGPLVVMLVLRRWQTCSRKAKRWSWWLKGCSAAQREAGRGPAR